MEIEPFNSPADVAALNKCVFFHVMALNFFLLLAAVWL